MITLQDVIPEVHDAVRQCFARHQFETFGDALAWLHEAAYEVREQESGSAGMPLFICDILWLISRFGPSTKVDHEIMDVQAQPLTSMAPTPTEDDSEEAPETIRPQRRRQRRRRRF